MICFILETINHQSEIIHFTHIPDITISKTHIHNKICITSRWLDILPGEVKIKVFQN